MENKITSLEQMLIDCDSLGYTPQQTAAVVEVYIKQFVQKNPNVTRVCPACQCCYFGTNQIINNILLGVYKE